MSVEDINKRLGAEIKRRRVEQGMTLEQFGKRSGLNANFLGGVERGHRNASVVTVERVAKGLGVLLTDLFGGTAGLTAAGIEAGRLFEQLPRNVRAAVLDIMRGALKATGGAP